MSRRLGFLEVDIAARGPLCLRGRALGTGCVDGVGCRTCRPLSKVLRLGEAPGVLLATNQNVWDRCFSWHSAHVLFCSLALGLCNQTVTLSITVLPPARSVGLGMTCCLGNVYS